MAPGHCCCSSETIMTWLLAQAVSTLQQEVAAMDESECGDVIVLPLYASLPPDQQVRTL